MKKFELPRLTKSLLFFLTILLFSSCVPQKDIFYLQDKTPEEGEAKTEFQNPKPPDYKLKSGDNLYIRVVSLDETVNNVFNTNQRNLGGGGQTNSNIYLQSYQIDPNGFITFPIIGKVVVSGLTIEEAQALIQEHVDKYLKETTVMVRLVNFKFTILGEVNRPGQFYVYQNDINIFEAIGLAGEITNYADRDNIKLVRKTDKGSEVHILDITDEDILESDDFYLMPDDVIYIKPIKGKNFVFQSFPYSVVFSSISTALLLINYFK
ncbi:MAG: polysaccharide export protein [Bacteroidales bacterium]|nr:polysaccharide export protein [Bacteroidales bacterium]